MCPCVSSVSAISLTHVKTSYSMPFLSSFSSVAGGVGDGVSLSRPPNWFLSVTTSESFVKFASPKNYVNSPSCYGFKSSCPSFLLFTRNSRGVTRVFTSFSAGVLANYASTPVWLSSK